MARSPSRAGWAACALALAVVPVLATAQPRTPHKKKPRASVATCALFDQVDREDEAVDLVIDNRCDAKLACSVSWTLACAPGSRRAQRFARSTTFELDAGAEQATTASAAECGDDGWVIDDVVWSCRPLPPPPR